MALRALIGASIGGAIGAAIWAAIAHFSGYEVGWIAWVVGAAVGITTRMMTSEVRDGFVPGMIAVGVAIAAVIVGKYAAVTLAVAGLGIDDERFQVSEEDMMVAIADEVVAEWEAKGTKLTWPDGMTVEEATGESDYPKNVWSEAKKRWTRLTAAEREKRLAARQSEMAETMKSLKESVRNAAFKQSFGGLDILWLLLAATSAFKLGAGVSSDD